VPEEDVLIIGAEAARVECAGVRRAGCTDAQQAALRKLMFVTVCRSSDAGNVVRKAPVVVREDLFAGRRGAVLVREIGADNRSLGLIQRRAVHDYVSDSALKESPETIIGVDIASCCEDSDAEVGRVVRYRSREAAGPFLGTVHI